MTSVALLGTMPIQRGSWPSRLHGAAELWEDPMRTLARFAAATGALLLLIAGCAGIASAPTQEERRALAPTGKLRVALYAGAPASIVRGATLDDSKGVGFDLGLR